MAGRFTPVIRRERLHPTEQANVLARFVAHAAAATCHHSGKGRAYVVGFFPGLEYSAGVRHDRFAMRRDFDAALGGFVSPPPASPESGRPGNGP